MSAGDFKEQISLFMTMADSICLPCSFVVRKPVFGVSDNANSNQSPQLQRLAGKLKFRSKQV